MKKAFISQPMNGLSNEEIVKNRKKAEEYLNKLGYEVVNNIFNADSKIYNEALKEKELIKNECVYYLGRSISLLSYCDAIYFVKDFETVRGCRIEYAIANNYGIKMIFEKSIEDEFVIKSS